MEDQNPYRSPDAVVAEISDGNWPIAAAGWAPR